MKKLKEFGNFKDIPRSARDRSVRTKDKIINYYIKERFALKVQPKFSWPKNYRPETKKTSRV